jgi:ribonuclease P protein component
MKRFGIHKSARIRSGADYEKIYQTRRRASDRVLLLFADVNSLGKTRFGLSVSRKHGGSVVRSRIKRLLREAYRLSQHELPAGLDLILIPQQPAAEHTLDDYRKSLVSLATQLARKLGVRTEQS